MVDHWDSDHHTLAGSRVAGTDGCARPTLENLVFPFSWAIACDEPEFSYDFPRCSFDFEVMFLMILPWFSHIPHFHLFPMITNLSLWFYNIVLWFSHMFQRFSHRFLCFSYDFPTCSDDVPIVSHLVLWLSYHFLWYSHPFLWLSYEFTSFSVVIVLWSSHRFRRFSSHPPLGATVSVGSSERTLVSAEAE